MPFARGDRRLYDTTLGWRFPNPRLEERFPLEAMGETGENVAERWDVSREDQDAFALRSQQRWAAANDAGRFDDELVPVGELTHDEHPRPDTSAEKLAMLRPAFRAARDGHRGQLVGVERRRRRRRRRLRGEGPRRSASNRSAPSSPRPSPASIRG